MPLHVQSINMRVVTEEALSELFEKAERNQVALVLQAPPELPRVSADTDRIRQVMLNLLDNAIKYAPGSTVTARLTPDGATLRVEVGDNGPGIPREDLPHIFEPMYRGARATGGAHGSGLGLTIVRTILDQHNAPIRVHSAPDQNTIFSFSLPLARPE
jgi:signal transduction histidine kinase